MTFFPYMGLVLLSAVVVTAEADYLVPGIRAWWWTRR